MPAHHIRPASLPGLPAVAAAALVAGCGIVGDGRNTTRVRVEDFAEPSPAPATSTPAASPQPTSGSPTQRPALTTVPTPTPATTPAPAPAPPAPAADTALEIRALPGRPLALGDDPDPVVPPQLLDAKVGDINGRPVFANEFLEPLSGRLRARGRQLDRRAWLAEASQLIGRELRNLITDELLRAEALSRLEPEQKQGLRFFIEGIRDQLQSQNYGSRELAEQRLEEEEGLSETEFLREREQTELIRLTIRQEIQARVNVSWRDIVQRYERERDQFNPPRQAVFRLVRLRSDNDAAIASVRSAIAAGAPPEEIARAEGNLFRREDGGAQPVDLEGSVAEATVFGVPALNEAAVSLEPGEHAGPIVTGDYTNWVFFEEIVDRSVPLYEAQLGIEQAIRSERSRDELERYIDRLLERASVTDIQVMGARLLRIADERYGPDLVSPSP